MNVRIVDIFSFLNETCPVKFSAQTSDTTHVVFFLQLRPGLS